jgi:hypothetical protein
MDLLLQSQQVCLLKSPQANTEEREYFYSIFVYHLENYMGYFWHIYF